MSTSHTPGAGPAETADALRRLTDAELATRPRLALVALLLLALAMTGVVGSLWVTEPALPGRTRLAFGVMTAIGSAWVAFASWALTQRRVLYAWQRVVAGRMSVVFSATFVLGALALGYASGQAGAYKAAAVGGLMLAAALGALLHATRTHARLVRRRDDLQRQLASAR